MADRLLYHAAPGRCRTSLLAHALNASPNAMPALPGTHLWQTREHAHASARPLGDDVWAFDCSGIPLDYDGPFSLHPGERRTPHPIAPERLRGRLPRPVSPDP